MLVHDVDVAADDDDGGGANAIALCEPNAPMNRKVDTSVDFAMALEREMCINCWQGTVMCSATALCSFGVLWLLCGCRWLHV